VWRHALMVECPALPCCALVGASLRAMRTLTLTLLPHTCMAPAPVPLPRVGPRSMLCRAAPQSPSRPPPLHVLQAFLAAQAPSGPQNFVLLPSGRDLHNEPIFASREGVAADPRANEAIVRVGKGLPPFECQRQLNPYLKRWVAGWLWWRLVFLVFLVFAAGADVMVVCMPSAARSGVGSCVQSRPPTVLIATSRAPLSVAGSNSLSSLCASTSGTTSMCPWCPCTGGEGWASQPWLDGWRGT
jgi:hypothetical protein